jgi:hypothetical protein
MVRAVHDMFAKEWMKELLTDFGEVKVERPVSSEVRKIDLVFYPNQAKAESLTALGLLGKMLKHPCPIEFFRNAVPAEEIVNCRGKAEDLRSELRRTPKAPHPRSALPVDSFTHHVTGHEIGFLCRDEARMGQGDLLLTQT